jgi:hypothetical protein
MKTRFALFAVMCLIAAACVALVAAGSAIPGGEADTENAPPAPQTRWTSEDSAFVGHVSGTSVGAFEVAIENTRTGEAYALSIEDDVSNLMNVVFLDENRAGITCHINPSLLSHTVFDLVTEAAQETYYGYGFADKDGTLYYIQAPPHFGGERGHHRILNAAGDVLYESAADRTIIGGVDKQRII